jgi:hypothetical protein
MEVVGVDFFVVHTLNLNGCVEKMVFTTAQVRHGRKSLQRLAALDVHGH